MCSGITRGRVLNGELYAQRFQTLIYLHLFTDCFLKISPQYSEQIQLLFLNHSHALYTAISPPPPSGIAVYKACEWVKIYNCICSDD